MRLTLRLTTRAALAVAAVACASPGFPPGGPEDRAAPQLLGTTPDSGTVDVRPPRVIFRFDEVVSERPGGTGRADGGAGGAQGLGRFFIISPRDGEPRIDWDREAIEVRPRRGWRPNTTYTITMLPGMTDLRGNTMRQGAVTVFSTGPTIPATRLRGIAFDWPAAAPLARAFVEAMAADSTVYVAQADSAGGFELAHLPAGRYVVRAIGDQNNNRLLEPRELWDSVAVTLADTARVELLAFVHDTIGPHLASVVPRDSVTLRVAFDKPLDPTALPDTSRFVLLRADSSRIPILQARVATASEIEQAPAARDRADSVRRAPARRDSLRRDSVRAPRRQPARDTTRAAGPLPSRPRPPREFILNLYPPLQAGSTYRLRANDIRGLLGATRTSDRAFAVPRAAADTAGQPPQRGAAPRAPGDTSRRRTPP